MTLAPYLAVLRTSRVPYFLVLMLFARIPATAAGLTITMHVLLGLERGYGEAGLVGAMSTIGIAVGSPLMGRLTDRRGLRAMLLVSLVAEGLFWFAAPALPYPVLLVTCFAAGIATMPVMALGRQITTALVAEADRRTAPAVDSMAVEVAFMAGPALAGTGDAITRLAPGTARGEALGLQGSAFTLGAAFGAPIAGYVIDHSTAAWGFFVSGAGAVPVAAVSWATARERSPQLV